MLSVKLARFALRICSIKMMAVMMVKLSVVSGGLC